MRWLGFLFFLLCLVPGAARADDRYLVRLWQSEEGLPGNVVRSLVQADDGFIWIATAEGIARFDGTQFELVEQDGDLRPSRFAFRRLFATHDGSIWAATFQGGLMRIRDGKLESIIADQTTPHPPVISQLISDENGGIYLKRNNEVWTVENGHVRQIGQPDRRLWGLFQSDLLRQLQSGRSISPGNAPQLMAKDGTVWTSDPNGRLVYQVPGKAQVALTSTGLPKPCTFLEMIEDREGNIWIATQLNGLVRIRKNRVDILDAGDGLSERAVFALLQDSRGCWWLANGRGGIDRWVDGESQSFEVSPNNSTTRRVSAIFEDHAKDIWVATQGGSVFRYRDGAFIPQFPRTPIPSKVRAICENVSADHTMWFGGEQGLASFDGTTVRSYASVDGIQATDITTLAINSENNLYVGSTEGDVFVGGVDGFQRLGPVDGVGNYWISGILPISKNEVWVSTVGGGLCLWNGHRWTSLRKDHGLPDLRLTCILTDKRGDFWFGSLGGVIHVSRIELLEKVKHPEAPLHWLRFDRSDGLPTRECIGGFQPAGWRGKDGNMWFPTAAGAVRIQPEEVQLNQVPPPVYLSQTRANGKQVTATDGVIRLEPGRTRLEFRYVGMSFSAPEKISYRTRMLGLDDQWRDTGAVRQVSYESVPAGKYTFEVLAINGDGTQSAEPARVSIIISPHFWETGWFVALATAIVLAISAGIGSAISQARMKARLQRLRIKHTRESERQRIARDLHDDLGASLTEISILAALAAEDGPKNSNEDLEQLSLKAKNAVSALDEIVWAVNPREDTLHSLVEYLAAYAREFLGNAHITLRSDVPTGIPESPLESTIRHGIFLATREALNNLVKHSEATEAKLSISYQNNILTINIEDNGKGFSLEWRENGYGVGNLQERMQSCGGTCEIITAPKRGTQVILTLPMLAENQGKP
jgi:signal transduction histidine kinase/ligand-binding sensor domain-containing protein